MPGPCLSGPGFFARMEDLMKKLIMSIVITALALSAIAADDSGVAVKSMCPSNPLL